MGTYQLGYTAMHHAAAWGKLDVIKALVEGNADMQLKTIHGERPREIAIRYHQNAVTEFLEWAGMQHFENTVY